jgi:hypothetical protein
MLWGMFVIVHRFGLGTPGELRAPACRSGSGGMGGAHAWGSYSSPAFPLPPYRFPCLVKLGGDQLASVAGLPATSHPRQLGPALPLVQSEGDQVLRGLVWMWFPARCWLTGWWSLLNIKMHITSRQDARYSTSRVSPCSTCSAHKHSLRSALPQDTRLALPQDTCLTLPQDIRLARLIQRQDTQLLQFSILTVRPMAGARIASQAHQVSCRGPSSIRLNCYIDPALSLITIPSPSLITIPSPSLITIPLPSLITIPSPSLIMIPFAIPSSMLAGRHSYEST